MEIKKTVCIYVIKELIFWIQQKEKIGSKLKLRPDGGAELWITSSVDWEKMAPLFE
ncbi:MAG: hypothetical protein NT010_06145 [Proteobacteria bacterium]|nr:hypothetical protein [Pseudomonadota bacterium]